MVVDEGRPRHDLDRDTGSPRAPGDPAPRELQRPSAGGSCHPWRAPSASLRSAMGRARGATPSTPLSPGHLDHVGPTPLRAVVAGPCSGRVYARVKLLACSDAIKPWPPGRLAPVDPLATVASSAADVARRVAAGSRNSDPLPERPPPMKLHAARRRRARCACVGRRPTWTSRAADRLALRGPRVAAQGRPWPPYARIILVYAPTKKVRMITPMYVCAVLR